MASAQLPSGTGVAAGEVLPRPRLRVTVRKRWTDNWEAAHYLQPLQATAAAAPLKSTARFLWRFGRIKYEDANVYRRVSQKDLRDWFVRVELLGGSSSSGGDHSDLWVGRIGVNDQSHVGVPGSSGGPVPIGDELYDAYGLEHELDRNPVRGSFVYNGEGNPPTFVDTPIVFNERFDVGLGHTVVGNRTAEAKPVPGDGGRSVHAFAGEKGATEKWSVGDIVRYLLAYYAPPELGFTLAGTAAEALDKIVLPRVDLNGRTVFQALNYLIDRRRGLGWCVRLSRAGGSTKPTVHVYSVLDEPVTFEDATIPANGEQLDLDLDELGHLVDGPAGLEFDTLNRYGKVVVSGARVLACFSVSELDETLQRGWTQDEHNAYRDGANLATGQPDAAEKNDKARAVDKLSHVFAHYHVPRVWNWKAGNGQGGGKSNANPLVSPEGRVKVGDSAQAPRRNWGHRFERHLPIRRQDAKEDSEPEFVAPFAVVFDEKHARWVFADQAPGRSATVRMLDNTLGVEVRFHPAHVLARTDWASAKPSRFDPAAEGYAKGKMICTVAVRTDERLEVELEIDKDGPLKERILHIEVPDAELWYLVPNTVTGVDPATGALQRSGTGSGEVLLRDDGERLRKIAALAKAWVGKERSALKLTVKDLWVQYPVGALVRSTSNRVREHQVNTPVSQVTWDLANATTTVRTNWAELDVTAGRSAGSKRT